MAIIGNIPYFQTNPGGGAVFHPLSNWSWRLESATGCEVLLELCKSRLHTFPDLGSKVKNHQTSIKETKKLMVIYGDLHGYIYIYIKPETQPPNVAPFFSLCGSNDAGKLSQFRPRFA